MNVSMVCRRVWRERAVGEGNNLIRKRKDKNQVGSYPPKVNGSSRNCATPLGIVCWNATFQRIIQPSCVYLG